MLTGSVDITRGAPPDRRPSGLGTVLRANRVARGWSQADLAARLGSSQSILSRWERGVLDPPLGSLAMLGDLLGLPIGRLVDSATFSPRRRSPRLRDRGIGRAVGAAVQAARLERNVPPIELSRAARLSPRRLHRTEGGHIEPTLAEVRRLGRALLIDLEPTALQGFSAKDGRLT